MTMHSKGVMPRPGDLVTLITKKGFRYEGTFSHVDKVLETVTLTKVTIFAKDNRPAPASDYLYVSVDFKVADIREFVIIHDKPWQLHDPAILRATPDVQSRQHHYNQPAGGYAHHGGYHNKNTGARQPHGHFRQPDQRTKPWPRRTQNGEYVPIFKQDQTKLRYGQHKHHAQMQRSPAKQHHHQQFVQRHVSEGVFPQRQPGAQPAPMEDFDFEESQKEFEAKRHEPENECDVSVISQDDAIKGEMKPAPAYDHRKNFFDSLSLSNNVYEDIRMVEKERQQARQRAAMHASPNRFLHMKELDVLTFGEDTLNSVMQYGNPMNAGRNPPPYRPTANFQKNYRGGNQKHPRGMQNIHPQTGYSYGNSYAQQQRGATKY